MNSAFFSIAVIASAFVLTSSTTAQKKSSNTGDKKYQYVQVTVPTRSRALISLPITS